MTGTTALHWVDITTLAAFGLGALAGARHGILRPLTRLVSYVGSVYATVCLNGPVIAQLQQHLREVDPAVPAVLAYAGTFLAAFLSLHVTSRFARALIACVRPDSRQIDEAATTVGLSPANRLCGAAAGVASSALLLGTLLLGAAACPELGLEPALQGSRLRGPVTDYTRAVFRAIPPERREELSRTVQWAQDGLIAIGGGLLGEGVHNLNQQATVLPLPTQLTPAHGPDLPQPGDGGVTSDGSVIIEVGPLPALTNVSPFDTPPAVLPPWESPEAPSIH